MTGPPDPVRNHHLAALAEDLNTTTTHHAAGPKGWHHPETRTISTRRGLGIEEYRSTMAHELAHAHYEDRACSNSWFHRRQERRADRWAADYLINEDHFLEAQQWNGNDLPAIAQDLEVTTHLLTVWINHHFKNRDHP